MSEPAPADTARAAPRDQVHLGSILLLLAVAACSGDGPSMEPVFDLVAEQRTARTITEVAALVVGDDRFRPHLIGGWSQAETDRELGRLFRWATGPVSEVVFHLVEPRELELVLEGRPRPGPPALGWRLEVAINGEAAGQLELEEVLASYRLPVSSGLLRRGENRLTLGNDWSAPVPGDSRALAVAWYEIGFYGLDQPAMPPRADPETGNLFIPYGTRVDYTMRVRDGAELRARDWRFDGPRGRLGIHLETDGAPARRLASLTEPAELAVALEAEAGTPVRLSLSAVSSAAPGEDGGALLTAPAVWAPQAVAPPASALIDHPRRRPNVLVYLVDTLRADRLGCYGNPRPVSPRIDRFADGATLFENARAQSSWTLSSVVSIFTGVWPPSHGVLQPSHKLAAVAVTLAEHLQAAGYATSAIVANGLVGPAHGTDQGFEEYRALDVGRRKSDLLLAESLAWLERRDRSRPFFLYLHTIDPHTPYLPAEEERRRLAPEAEEMFRSIEANPRVERWQPTATNIEQLLALYDAEIAENDESFGATLDYLEEQGLLEDTLVVFLSDHGEEFYEHSNWNHGVNLYRETLDMPLIVKMPDQREGRRVTAPAQQIDLLPTLLDVLGLELPAVEGRSLLPLLTSATAGPAPPVFAHVERRARAWVGVIDGDWKYVAPLSKGDEGRLYNWREDPEERHNRAAERPILTALLRAAVERRLLEESTLAAEPAVLDDAAQENLRALGYID